MSLNMTVALVLVHPSNTRPDMTEKLLTGMEESTRGPDGPEALT